MNQHVKVTFDFTNYNYGTYDLAVPAYLLIKNLIALVLDSLDISIFDVNTQIKVMTKGQLLVENDRLIDYQIADGDILKLL
ncbi:TPA: type VII secretion protein EsaB [Staphylococcus aureus]|uniref:type VII secretion protein EsaB n=1 Tax=Staphylococcus aureus TaxID=1280 RepID=UPI0004498AA3|nr:type VII secretion protein EsaB [Staphylococcus aureus]EUQ80953.1 protein esaB [Staphylococcus aureus OCMM6047]HCU7769806.1 type VII secretion protein EsaB [Staphylococcus aureus]HCU8181852.1 type VII secretion protein EsaB [Staphylococcus aureus]HCX9778627.1 type VII secretion protein EsaB [Staphylococcus aureus]HDA0730940.1 type VII secretion protein EsaB [Staphylococcus aureus]